MTMPREEARLFEQPLGLVVVRVRRLSAEAAPDAGEP